MIPHWPDAQCRLDPDAARIFFPGPGDQRPSTAKAVRICHQCRHLTECGDWALNNPDEASHGIWGGMTAYQRHKILQGRRPR